MDAKLMKYQESDCQVFRFYPKAQIIARGTEHPTFHSVEMYDKVDILSLTPYVDRGIVCLLCKFNSGTIISIPAEWLKMMEE